MAVVFFAGVAAFLDLQNRGRRSFCFSLKRKPLKGTTGFETLKSCGKLGHEGQRLQPCRNGLCAVDFVAAAE